MEWYNIHILNQYTYLNLGNYFFLFELIDLNLTFFFDNLSVTSALLVNLLTLLAYLFGIEYMYKELFNQKLIYLLNMFATSVILLFISYDFFLIIIC